MELKPQVALDALVNILQRIPLSPAESVGAQHCIETIKARLDLADKLTTHANTPDAKTED